MATDPPVWKYLNARVQLKHDTPTNWGLKPNFIPEAGEIIIYDADSTHETRIKIGDGSTKVSVLPFVNGVTSINGQTGDVTLTIPTVPSNVSSFANDAGYLTSAPVTSVNGSTGDVTITIPTKVSDLTNDSGYLTSYTETDPTVPSWAKASSKPSYTASEVGAVPTTRKVNGKALSSDITLSASDVSALPSSTSIPSKTSDLTNDSGFVTTDHTYNFNGEQDFYSTSGITSAYPRDCNSLTANGHYYYTSNGPATSLGATTADGSVYVQAYSDIWVCQIAQDYRTGHLFVRSRNNGTWTDWKKVYDSGIPIIPYGECISAQDTVAKTVTVSPAITELTTGQVIAVKFSFYNLAQSPTLNVNNLGAKGLLSHSAFAPAQGAAYSWQSGQTVLFRYDGTYWVQLTSSRPVAASSSVAGLMSATHYSKLEGIEANANNYSLPTASSSTLGGVKVGSGLSISDGVLSVSGSGLPAVTASDNGKFLQVVNGAWAAVEIPYANGVSF